jgi:Fe-S cluster assembly protein SufB
MYDNKLGFNTGTEGYSFKAKKGLSEELVREISKQKNEPQWMLDTRLVALKQYYGMAIPSWGADLTQINWEDIHYYLKPVDKQFRTWEDVPDNIKKVFDTIGVPEAEKKMLAGVGSQYDSEVIYHSLQKVLAKKGVIFLSMDAGLKQYPEIVKEYFGKIVPYGDNKLAALNTAVWSGGSFVYIPKNVKVDLPLQAYFRINAENAGQFERTLIVAEEESSVHYVEGCFPAGVNVLTNGGEKKIENITIDDLLLSHKGIYRKIRNLQKRKYTGKLFEIKYYGDSTRSVLVTEEHPFLAVKRRSKNDRNKIWKHEWLKPEKLVKGDYLAIPLDRNPDEQLEREFVIKEWKGKKLGYVDKPILVLTNESFYRLVGYYLAEGSISSGSYLNFSFSENEREYIEDVKMLVKEVFGFSSSHESAHKKNHGASVVFNSVELCRIFEFFGTHNENKKILEWMFGEDKDKLKEIVIGWFRGDGNYYTKKHPSGYKEAFRGNTTSECLARQMIRVLRHIGIPAFINSRDRSKENRRRMYTVGVTGEWMVKLGDIFKIPILRSLNNKNRSSMYGYDGEYVYVPIKSTNFKEVVDIDVYNFGVEIDESYIASGVAVHNCSAPAYSSASLHAAVVEVVVKEKAKVRYTTVQNWYKTVYNLVTKRAVVEQDGAMEWIDCNLGSRLTMKYPCCILKGERAHGEMLSIAVAGEGQQQDAGAKMIHLAANTTSKITSKSISRSGGRSSYRGRVMIGPKAKGARSKVVCDALIMDPESRSDTYPDNQVLNGQATIEHEAYVSRIGEEQIMYLMSRGMTAKEAEAMIIRGFIEPVIQELPMEYAVELNRLVRMEMIGSVG